MKNIKVLFFLTAIIYGSVLSVQAEITAAQISPSTADDNHFDQSYAISGDWAIVGSWGKAYMFQYNGTEWEEHSVLTQDDGRNNYFGRSVAIAGDRAIIGAPGSNVNIQTVVEAVDIYYYDGTNWELESHIVTPSDDPNTGFGNSVSISGDRAIVGAPYDDEAASYYGAINTGAAYLLHYDGSSWNVHSKITSSDRTSNGVFGESVSISGEHAIVGAPKSYVGRGVAYIFHYDGTNWDQQGRILPSGRDDDDELGESVAIEGDWAIAGAKYDQEPDSSGAAYIYHYDGTSWEEHTKLTAGDGPKYSEFGTSVAISGGQLVIGAPSNSDKQFSAGAAYIYSYNGTSWTEQFKLHATDAQRLDYFGATVAISDRRVLVAELFNRQRIFIYEYIDLPSCPTLYYWNTYSALKHGCILGGAIAKENEYVDTLLIKDEHLASQDGYYVVQIQEEGQETSYIDTVQLRVIERVFDGPQRSSAAAHAPHFSSTTKYSHMAAKAAEDFQPHTLAVLHPASAEHSASGDVLALIDRPDEQYAESATGDTITIYFPVNIDLRNNVDFLLSVKGYYEPLE